MARHEVLTSYEIEDIAAKVNEVLRREGLSVNALARKAGVDQPMARQVACGAIKLRTPKVRRLLSYVYMILDDRSDPDFASFDRSVRDYVAQGGALADLAMMISAMARVMESAREPQSPAR